MKLFILLPLLLSAIFSFSQIAEPNRVVFENKYFRASSLVITRDAPQKLLSKQHALVIVPITEVNLNGATELAPGAVQYVVPGGKQLSLTSAGSQSKIVVVELLQQYSDVHSCAAPKQCVRSIRFGDAEIGETTSLFRGGGLTVDRHRIVPGASLTSNYFTAHMQSHVLLVALTDVDASFGGDPQILKLGQVYFTDAEQAEISAGNSDSRWAVIRVLGNPQTTEPHVHPN